MFRQQADGLMQGAGGFEVEKTFGARVKGADFLTRVNDEDAARKAGRQDIGEVRASLAFRRGSLKINRHTAKQITGISFDSADPYGTGTNSNIGTLTILVSDCQVFGRDFFKYNGNATICKRRQACGKVKTQENLKKCVFGIKKANIPMD
ncbi:MAG TPA: hypothetical protein VH598_14120 [Verrucomicrobiae bacterium]|nr:hypothetical protein [Verrucomicrobiae bacterium]